MTAPTRPPRLAAMVPAMTFASARHFIYHGGIFVSPILSWFMHRQVKPGGSWGCPTPRRAAAGPAAGRPVELEVNLGYTSYVVRAGQRLQVYVGGSVYPYVHLNTWEPFESWSQARPATNTVHLGAKHRSRIIVPVIPR